MILRNNEHKQRYLDLLGRMKRKDAYHRSAAYLMALANLVPNDVFDFERDCIKPEGLYEDWQTSSSRKATRLMFNLWNGRTVDDQDCPETSCYYAVDEIFSNYEYAAYFYEAVRIRFEWV